MALGARLGIDLETLDTSTRMILSSSTHEKIREEIAHFPHARGAQTTMKLEKRDLRALLLLAAALAAIPVGGDRGARQRRPQRPFELSRDGGENLAAISQRVDV